MKLDAVNLTLKSGNEKFSLDGKDTNIRLNDFWSWAQSDLLNNALRVDILCVRNKFLNA